MKKTRSDEEAIAFVRAQMERRSGLFNCKDLREMVRDEQFTKVQFHIAVRALHLKGHTKPLPSDRAFNAWLMET